MSARTGVLMSHGMFAIFWILLGCMQQVQEAVRTSLTAQPSPSSLLPTQGPSKWASPPTVLSPETLNQYQQQQRQQQDQYQPISTPPSFSSSHLSPEFLLASRTPFWIVWHMAIVLLGLGTGLMTSCAHQLEQDLYAEYNDEDTSVHPLQVPVEKDEGRTSVFTNDQKLWWGSGATTALKEDEQEKCQQHSTLHDSQVELVARSCGLVSSAIAARAPSSTATAAAASAKAGVGSVSILRSSLLSRAQRVFLAVVLVVLLMAQVWLFQYVVMADYEDIDNADSLLLLQTNIHHNHAYRSKSVQVSSTLATFGLFFGMAMMFIGARILPTPPSSPAGRPYIL
ncbi:hypothetical protein BGW42_004590 [Actinomortierella wolfii]|nr:hypothetical protein BGW42_004590 [Actinomortierella wolfii]